MDICLPNYLHARAAIAAATAGKHVIIEKPLCLTLEEADEMIAACEAHNRKLMYAEELCFAPKYERVRQLVRRGRRRIDLSTCGSARSTRGPHSDWFYDLESIRRRRVDGHGMPRLRLVPLDARPRRGSP